METGEATRQWYFQLADAGPAGFAAVQSDRLWLHDNGTEQTIELPDGYLKTVVSKGGKYFGIARLAEISGSVNSNLLFEVYSADGNPQYSLNRLHFKDDAFPAFSLSDVDGSVVVGQNTSRALGFYDRSGKLKKQIELFKESDYDLERVLIIDRSLKGQAAVVMTDRSSVNPPDRQTGPALFLFDQDGNEIWRQILPGAGSSVVAISPDGSYVFSNAYTVESNGRVTMKSLLLDSGGNLVAEFDFLCKRVNFSQDSQFTILSDNRQALLIDLRAHQIVGRYHLSDPQEIIAAAAIADGGKLSSVLAARLEYENNRFIYQMPRLQILDHKGELVQQFDFAGRTFETPALSMSPDGDFIVTGFEEAYEVYELKR